MDAVLAGVDYLWSFAPYEYADGFQWKLGVTPFSSVEFLAASMTLDKSNTDKLSEFRSEARRLGVPVEPRPCSVRWSISTCARAPTACPSSMRCRR